MAKAGNYSAYQGIPIREDYGDNMGQAEDRMYRQQQADRQKEQQDYQRQREQEQDYMTDLEKQKAVITGIETVDQINYRLYNQSLKRIGDIHRALASGDLSRDERQKLLTERGMINKLPELLQASTNHLTEYATKVAQGIEDGTVSEWELQELEKVKSFFGVEGADGRITPNYILDLKEGVPLAKIMTEDGQYEEIPFTDVFNGSRFNLSTIVKPVDSSTYASEFVKNLGERQQSRINGGFIESFQTFDSQRDRVGGLIEEALGTKEKPSALAKSIWSDAGNLEKSPSEWGEGSIQEVKDFLMGKIEGGYDEYVEQKQLYTGGGDNGSAGERKLDEQGYAYYTLVNGAATNDASSISSAEGITKNYNGESRTIGEVVTTPDSWDLLDVEGKLIEKIDRNAPLEERRGAWKRWFSKSNDASEDEDMYNRGGKQAGWQMPEVSSEPTTKKGKKVSVVSDEVIDNVTITDSPYDMQISLTTTFPLEETGLSFVGKSGGMFSDPKILVSSGVTGRSEEFNLEDTSDRKKLKEFIKANSKQETSYDPVEEKKQETNKPAGGKDSLNLFEE